MFIKTNFLHIKNPYSHYKGYFVQVDLVPNVIFDSHAFPIFVKVKAEYIFSSFYNFNLFEINKVNHL